VIASRREEKRPKRSPRAYINRPAKKSLGQNFLIDDNISRKIVAALSLSRENHVIEIGPGRGALTRLLASTGTRITAIEKDANLVESLKEEFSSDKNLEIVAGDFLEYPFPPGISRFKVIGNIPYNLTSRIVSRLVDERARVDSAVLMVQDEVAERLAALPGTKEYGAISIRLQLVADVERLFLVSPSCFRPRPKVDSRVIRITFKDRTLLYDEAGFVRFIKGAFGMRRKMFRHFVSHNYGKESIDLLEEKFRTGRVETFAPSDIYSLYTILEKNVRR
jgi:16S rRNA (adenine1518-N6/adenine1519-N6)-dimethyltransferase